MYCYEYSKKQHAHLYFFDKFEKLLINNSQITAEIFPLQQAYKLKIRLKHRFPLIGII